MPDLPIPRTFLLDFARSRRDAANAAPDLVESGKTKPAMPKINNAQRAAFARLLTQAKQEVEKAWPETLRISKWDSFDPEAEPPVINAFRRHKLPALRATAQKAEAVFEAAISAANADLKATNEKRRQDRVASLDSFTQAIRDVWAAQDLESAEVIVRKFIGG